MNGSLKVVQGIVLLSFLGMMLSSCGGSQTTLSSSDSVSGTPVTNPTPSTSGTDTIEEEEKNATIPSGYSASNLFVAVPDTMNFLNYSSLTGSWSNRCSFTSSSVVNDLTCNVEVSELDLFYNGIKLQMNVPANQCKYIRTTPYWYYNYEVGVGASDVTVVVNKDASGTVTSTACTVDGVGPFSCSTATPPTAAADIEFDIADEIKVKCKYDTSDEVNGANCCFGKYRLRTTVITPDSSTSSDERGKDWGGNAIACIGGQGKTDWKDYDSDGYPTALIERMTENVARTKIVKTTGPLSTIGSRRNIPVANYFTVGLHTHSGYGAASGTVFSDYPYYIDPISDRSGTLIEAASPYYDFECLDEAFETNYRLRILVQDWDTVAALQTYASTGSSSVSPDEPGTAPADCPGLSGTACNQVQDADNFVAPFNSYDNANPDNRRKYFPRNVYK